MAEILFGLFSLICVGAVLAMILTRNQAHGALYLVLAFAALGGIFGLLGAAFAAVIQILIYAGAIMVLFIFIIMTIPADAPARREPRRGTIAAALVLAALLLAEIVLAARGLILRPGPETPAAAAPAEAVGRGLLTDFLYPFEIASVLIMAAVVGAVVLGKKREGE